MVCEYKPSLVQWHPLLCAALAAASELAQIDIIFEILSLCSPSRESSITIPRIQPQQLPPQRRQCSRLRGGRLCLLTPTAPASAQPTLPRPDPLYCLRAAAAWAGAPAAASGTGSGLSHRNVLQVCRPEAHGATVTRVRRAMHLRSVVPASQRPLVQQDATAAVAPRARSPCTRRFSFT